MKRSWTNKLTAGLMDKSEPLGIDSRHLFNDRYKSIHEDPERKKRSWLSKLTLGIFD